MSRPQRVALVSLEAWDEVWRRNQHFALELVRQRLISELIFIEPGRRGRGRSFRPVAGIRVVRPPVLLPRRWAGRWAVALFLRLRYVRRVDLLWANDASVGSLLLSRRTPAVYDVTDDWRESQLSDRTRRTWTRGEDILSRRARVIVCSEVLRARWQERYSVDAPVVQNGYDEAAFADPSPMEFRTPPPHVGYIGTLHHERLDLDVLESLAGDTRIGTLHLVGPNSLNEESRSRLSHNSKIKIHGPVPARDVPSWMAAMDVLISPHQVTPFTLSLDGIKMHEYLASSRPVVSTPTSGFQNLPASEGVAVVAPSEFGDAVIAMLNGGPFRRPKTGSWAQRAREFAEAWEEL